MTRPGELVIQAARDAYEIARGERAPVEAEITGDMWLAGKREFEKWANRFQHAKTTAEMTAASDCAPAEIWKAMKRARAATPISDSCETRAPENAP